MKTDRYFLNIYLKQEKPKTVKEWAKFLNVREGAIYDRVRNQEIIEIDYNIKSFDFIHSFELQKEKNKSII